MLDSFAESCRSMPSTSEIKARATGLGWVAEEPAATSPLSKMIVRWRDLAEHPDPGAKIDLSVATFRRLTAGRQTWLVVHDTSASKDNKSDGEQTCTVFDTSASRDDFAFVRASARKHEVKSFEGAANEMAVVNLTPEMVAGSKEVAIAFVPDDGSDFSPPGVSLEATR